MCCVFSSKPCCVQWLKWFVKLFISSSAASAAVCNQYTSVLLQLQSSALSLDSYKSNIAATKESFLPNRNHKNTVKTTQHIWLASLGEISTTESQTTSKQSNSTTEVSHIQLHKASFLIPIPPSTWNSITKNISTRQWHVVLDVAVHQRAPDSEMRAKS